jgi:hypothetical protein
LDEDGSKWNWHGNINENTYSRPIKASGLPETENNLRPAVLVSQHLRVRISLIRGSELLVNYFPALDQGSPRYAINMLQMGGRSRYGYDNDRQRRGGVILFPNRKEKGLPVQKMSGVINFGNEDYPLLSDSSALDADVDLTIEGIGSDCGEAVRTQQQVPRNSSTTP